MKALDHSIVSNGFGRLRKGISDIVRRAFEAELKACKNRKERSIVKGKINEEAAKRLKDTNPAHILW